ncbi:sideroflexin-4 isoform X2 [Balaenoptera ricei]|uniref:sideroflexin-4 isoform X2 n=1 Tax=Balaenoptera ricei TaxID=2746895 RepID=UPI0028BE9ABD|nr:sideroflexin-4 isoform X2 [Balaenoptera ricei]
MEPNVRFWITERQSFIQRFLQWTELLDPTNLVVSVEKIEKSRQLLLTHEDASRSDLEDKTVQEAWKRSLSTVHPDNSKLIPGPFRPAALLPFTAPMVFLSVLPVKSLKSMILPQVSFYTYSTVFNIVNGNASYDRRPHESILLGAGVIASSTFFGLFPRLLQVRFSLNSILSRNVIPVVILAQLSGLNVVASRSLEPLRGIEVMDKEGSVIGYSRKAGTKAIKDTATSRVVLFGTSAFIPEVFSYFFKRYSAVSLKRKFNLQQKKQNSSITEGCRGPSCRPHLSSCPPASPVTSLCAREQQITSRCPAMPFRDSVSGKMKALPV